MAGRRTKNTARLREMVSGCISRGLTYGATADFVGLGRSTFYRWMERGRIETAGDFREFRDTVYHALASFQETHLATIRAAATSKTTEVREKLHIPIDKEGNPTGKPLRVEQVRITRPPSPRWAAWLLKQRFPADFGK